MGITWRDAVTTLIIIGIGGIFYLVSNGTHMSLLTNVRLIIIFLSLIGILVWFMDFLPTISRAHPMWSGLLAACGMVLFLDSFFGIITGVGVTVTVLIIGIFVTWALVTIEHIFVKKEDK